MNKRDDNTRLVRFVNEKYAKKAIGTKRLDSEVEYTFHFGLLSDYRKMENNAGDLQEGRIKIKEGGESASCCEFMTSCWSIWDVDNEIENDPWLSFKDSSFTNIKDGYVWAVTSTVGKVRQKIDKIMELNKMLFGNNQNTIFCPEIFDGYITYYSEKNGYSRDVFNELTDPVKSGDIFRSPLVHLFHKRDRNPKNNQSYESEREYRFAIMLQPGVFYETGIKLDAQHVIMKDYPIILDKDAYHIDKVYVKSAGRNLEKDGNYQHISMVCFEEDIELVTL